MKMLLVYPRWDYPTFGQIQEPLGILYIAAALKAAGHEAVVKDLAVDDVESVDAEVKTADVVGMSSSTALYGRACRLLDRIKAARPGLPVVIGGPHATVLTEDTVRRGFDAAVVGEGEHTVVELLEALESGRPLHEVAGVMAMNNGVAAAGPARAFEADFDALADPDRTLIDYDAYYAKNLENVGMMATRGCPYNCIFCKPMQDKLFGRKVRTRSSGRIAGEMKWIADELGRKRYLFKDDTLAMNSPEWFAKFEVELGEAGLGDASWSCQARVDQIDRPLLISMIRCGLCGIAFGVESGSQRVLDFYKKGIKVEQTERAFALCRELGVGTHAFIMLGAPDETRDDLDATVRLIERIRPNTLSMSVTTPAPGTALHERVIKAGLSNLAAPEDSDYHYNRDPIKLTHINAKDIARTERAILDLVPGALYMDQMEKRARSLAGET